MFIVDVNAFFPKYSHSERYQVHDITIISIYSYNFHKFP
jgi:hypothetical protein